LLSKDYRDEIPETLVIDRAIEEGAEDHEEKHAVSQEACSGNPYFVHNLQENLADYLI
jgi:hypothetical protein